MSDIIFSCECGMILKVRSGEQTGGLIDCPSCKASVRVPAVREAEIAPPRFDPEVDPAPEPESAGHQNFAIVYITILSLLTIAAVGFFLVPALTGAKDRAPDRALASGSSNEESTKNAAKTTKTAKKPDNKRTDRPGAKGSSKPRSKSSADASESSAPLPRYDDVTPSPRPNVPPTEASAPPRPAPVPPAETRPPDPIPPQPSTMFNADAPLERSPADNSAPKKSAGKAKSKPAAVLSAAAVKLEEAKRLEFEGKKADALAAFQAVADQYPASIEYNFAKNRIKVLKEALAPAKPQSSPPHGGITPRG